MRAYDYEYQIDGKPLLLPDAGVELTFSDLDADDAGRDESGFMHRQVVRERVRTWSFSYGSLTHEEYRYLMSLLEGRHVFAFSHRGLDGRAESVTAYCAKGSITLYNRRLGLYKNFKLNIIEC